MTIGKLAWRDMTRVDGTVVEVNLLEIVVWVGDCVGDRKKLPVTATSNVPTKVALDMSLFPAPI